MPYLSSCNTRRHQWAPFGPNGYRVSGLRPSLNSPEVPGSPVWTPILVIRSVHCMSLSLPEQPAGTREPRVDPGVSYQVSASYGSQAARRYQGAPFGPDGYLVSGLRPSPSSPQVPGSPFGPRVSYQVSALCGLRPSPSSPEVARAPNEPTGSKHTAQQTCEWEGHVNIDTREPSVSSLYGL